MRISRLKTLPQSRRSRLTHLLKIRLPRVVPWKALHPAILMPVVFESCFMHLKKLIRQMPGMSGWFCNIHVSHFW
jgi:hypothetical protein